MRRILILIFPFLFLLPHCTPKTTPDVYIDVSPHFGRVPLHVIGYVFFNKDVDCVEVIWQYWYSGFSMDRNEAKEKVCGEKVLTHEFIFTTPGRVNILILVRSKSNTYRKSVQVSVGE